MKLGIVKLIVAGLAGYAMTNVALQATASPSPARPSAARDMERAPLGGPTRKPIGWYNLCQVQANECHAGARKPVNVALTADAVKLLTTVTTLANHVIDPRTDDDHYHLDRKTLVDWWTYPDSTARATARTICC